MVDYGTYVIQIYMSAVVRCNMRTYSTWDEQAQTSTDFCILSCLCMYGYIYLCMGVCISGCMDAWMHGCMDECMHVYIYIYIQYMVIYRPVCMNASIHGSMHACIQYHTIYLCLCFCSILSFFRSSFSLVVFSTDWFKGKLHEHLIFHGKINGFL